MTQGGETVGRHRDAQGGVGCGQKARQIGGQATVAQADIFGMSHKPRAGVCGGPGPAHKRGAQPFLQGLDALRDGGLRHAQPGREGGRSDHQISLCSIGIMR